MNWNHTDDEPAQASDSSSPKSEPTTTEDNKSRPRAMASTSHHGGYHRTITIVRSVLHHKLGLPLACYLYSPDVYYRVMEHFPELPVSVVHPGAPQKQRQRQKQRRRWLRRTEFNHVLIRTCHAWYRAAGECAPQETSLTDHLSQNMDEALRPYQMTVVHNHQSLENPKIRPDIVVRHVPSSGHPVLVIEVGLSNAKWWNKVDQCLVGWIGLRNEEHEIKHPVLLAVLTMESRKRKNKSVFSWARIGTFLATSTKKAPAVVSDVRISLLHRAETTTVRALSAELGKLMRAACLLPAWVSAPALVDGIRPRPRHESLGPNCRRVGSVVLRVYDNRLVDTERRPDVYITWKAAEELCTLTDGKRPLFTFGQRGTSSSDDLDRLWWFRGCCAVYVTLYREGPHVAWSALDLLPPVSRLLELHKHGLVHGDIRCCNIVFGPTGDLVDYDLGGKIDLDDPTKSPKYPTGYRGNDIPDGFRRGREGGTITMRDDWAAMCSVIFEKHLVLPPAKVRRKGAEEDEDDELSTLRLERKLTDDKNGLIAFFLGDGPDDVVEIEGRAVALLELLRSMHAAGWTVQPHPTLVPTLELWGLDVAPPRPTRRDGGWGATKKVSNSPRRRTPLTRPDNALTR